MTKLLISTLALVGAMSMPALAASTDSTQTANDLASMEAMNTAMTNSAGEMAELQALTTVGEVVVIDTASFNESTNQVDSMNAMRETGRALAPEVQASINANPALLAKIQSEQPSLDLGTVYAINVTPEGNVYLYTGQF